MWADDYQLIIISLYLYCTYRNKQNYNVFYNKNSKQYKMIKTDVMSWDRFKGRFWVKLKKNINILKSILKTHRKAVKHSKHRCNVVTSLSTSSDFQRFSLIWHQIITNVSMSRIKVTKASVKNMEFLTNISQLVENHERSMSKLFTKSLQIFFWKKIRLINKI